MNSDNIDKGSFEFSQTWSRRLCKTQKPMSSFQFSLALVANSIITSFIYGLKEIIRVYLILGLWILILRNASFI